MTNRELDALVAEKVMGWIKIDLTASAFDTHGLSWMWDQKEGCFYWECQKTPNYSTNIADAWLVVEKFKHRGLEVGYDRYRSKWFCTNLSEDFRYGLDFNEEELRQSFNSDIVAAVADTASLAIALVALQLVGYNPTPGAAR